MDPRRASAMRSVSTASAVWATARASALGSVDGAALAAAGAPWRRRCTAVGGEAGDEAGDDRVDALAAGPAASRSAADSPATTRSAIASAWRS
jgi:hypothetical protein